MKYNDQNGVEKLKIIENVIESDRAVEFAYSHTKGSQLSYETMSGSYDHVEVSQVERFENTPVVCIHYTEQHQAVIMDDLPEQNYTSFAFEVNLTVHEIPRDIR